MSIHKECAVLAVRTELGSGLVPADCRASRPDPKACFDIVRKVKKCQQRQNARRQRFDDPWTRANLAFDQHHVMPPAGQTVGRSGTSRAAADHADFRGMRPHALTAALIGSASDPTHRRIHWLKVVRALFQNLDIGLQTVMEPTADIVASETPPFDDLMMAAATAQIPCPT
jgi:hypothetical protein